MLIFLFEKRFEYNINNDNYDVLDDMSNLFYISTVAIRELFFLIKKDEIELKEIYNASDIFAAIDFLGVEIKPVTRQHLSVYYDLKPVKGHNDPNDHMIIAQAISDKIPLVSSDGFFRKYIPQGLELVFNKR
jgi:PIN domain nuclease of toxin-antitoxin system